MTQLLPNNFGYFCEKEKEGGEGEWGGGGFRVKFGCMRMSADDGGACGGNHKVLPSLGGEVV